MTTDPVLEVTNLSIGFSTHTVDIPAVAGFDCRVMAGETVGLVGESGSGKSTVAFAIMRYLGSNGRITDGSIRFMGQDLATLPRAELRRIWGRDISMVYQEPSSSLNPSMRIGRQLAEPLVVVDGEDRAKAEARALEMLESVRLPDPDRIMMSYPHQISGGQQQRVVIAMALLRQP
ncbi:MAG: ATP-binding cassette domain-containing protein, partial [Gammaproteobacteria bacterium]|nr:ATP-binding cassette domain-containing protein [Gammaproteobacteria bacterium]